MTTIAVVFAPALEPDPKDSAQMPRRLGELIPDGSDFVLIWREWGEQFEDGKRTHVLSSGAWENITRDQITGALASILDE